MKWRCSIRGHTKYFISDYDVPLNVPRGATKEQIEIIARKKLRKMARRKNKIVRYPVLYIVKSLY